MKCTREHENEGMNRSVEERDGRDTQCIGRVDRMTVN